MHRPCPRIHPGRRWVNDDIAIDRLNALGALEDFVSQVAAFITLCT